MAVLCHATKLKMAVSRVARDESGPNFYDWPSLTHTWAALNPVVGFSSIVDPARIRSLIGTVFRDHLHEQMQDLDVEPHERDHVSGPLK